MKKLICSVLSLALLFSVASSSFAIPQEKSKLLKVSLDLDGTQITKASAVGLGVFAIYRLIANAETSSGYGQMLVNGLGYVGNGLLAMGPTLLHTFQFGMFAACVSGVAYGIDYASDHMFSKKLKSMLKPYLES